MKFPAVHQYRCSCAQHVGQPHTIDPICRALNTNHTKENQAYLGHRAAIQGLTRSNARLKRNLAQKIADVTQLRTFMGVLPGGESALTRWIEHKRAIAGAEREGLPIRDDAFEMMVFDWRADHATALDQATATFKVYDA